MSKTPPKVPEPTPVTGRAVFDERDGSKWEFLSETGTFRSDIDTKRLQALGAGLSCEDLPKPKLAEANPYDRATPTPVGQAAKKSKSRSLDDMRRLSEEIKAARESAPADPKVRDNRNK